MDVNRLESNVKKIISEINSTVSEVSVAAQNLSTAQNASQNVHGTREGEAETHRQNAVEKAKIGLKSAQSKLNNIIQQAQGLSNEIASVIGSLVADKQTWENGLHQQKENNSFYTAGIANTESEISKVKRWQQELQLALKQAGSAMQSNPTFESLHPLVANSSFLTNSQNLYKNSAPTLDEQLNYTSGGKNSSIDDLLSSKNLSPKWIKMIVDIGDGAHYFKKDPSFEYGMPAPLDIGKYLGYNHYKSYNSELNSKPIYERVGPVYKNTSSDIYKFMNLGFSGKYDK